MTVKVFSLTISRAWDSHATRQKVRSICMCSRGTGGCSGTSVSKTVMWILLFARKWPTLFRVYFIWIFHMCFFEQEPVTYGMNQKMLQREIKGRSKPWKPQKKENGWSCSNSTSGTKGRKARVTQWLKWYSNRFLSKSIRLWRRAGRRRETSRLANLPTGM